MPGLGALAVVQVSLGNDGQPLAGGCPGRPGLAGRLQAAEQVTQGLGVGV